MNLTSDGPSRVTTTMLAIGDYLVKTAGEPVPVYNLAGTLYHSPSGYILLSVPNALVRGVFAAIHEPGVELPPGHNGGAFNAHITVIRPNELAMLGGADKISERGKQFPYSLGRFVELVPEWPGVSKAYMLTVHSPALQALRRSYGLSSLPDQGKKAFHITCGIRRRGVLGYTEKSKT